MRISDWSSDVCSSDLGIEACERFVGEQPFGRACEYSREQDAGTLAAREFVDRAIQQIGGGGRGDGVGDRGVIILREPRERRMVLGAAERDHVARGPVPVDRGQIGRASSRGRVGPYV